MGSYQYFGHNIHSLNEYYYLQHTVHWGYGHEEDRHALHHQSGTWE